MLSDEADTHFAIEALNTEFAWALDERDTACFDQIFCADATYTSGANTLVGLDAIRAYFAHRNREWVRTTRHLYSNLSVQRLADNRALSTSVWISFAANAVAPTEAFALYMVADFHDVYRKDGGRWKILNRRIASVFRNPDVAPRT